MKKKSLNQFKSKAVKLPKTVKGGNEPEFNPCENALNEAYAEGWFSDGVYATLLQGC